MLKRLLLLALAIGSSAASTPSCYYYFDRSIVAQHQTPTLMCSDFTLVLAPGTCTSFGNPCQDDGQWIAPHDFRRDGFAIANRPATVAVHEELTNGVLERSLCAAPGAGDIDGLSMPFLYERQNVVSAFGTGHLTLVLATPISVTATANPVRIHPGEFSQLVATASGGIPPYSYSWIPRSGIPVTNIPAPTASPSIDTVYTVFVTDHTGLTAHADVAVSVDYDIVTANPPVVNPGDVIQLSASSNGGRPPYTYSWSPADWLDDPTRQGPVAYPPTNITYTVVATDANGTQLTGSARVRVNLLMLTLTAAPASIVRGQTTQLETTAAGGDGNYTYLWSPATSLNDPRVRNPIASPTVSTDYEVVITDGEGATQRSVVHVNVTQPVNELGAAFSFVRGALDVAAQTIHWTFDASASAGTISSYHWVARRTVGVVPVLDTVTTSPILEVDLPEDVVRGTMTLTVTAPDGTTSSLTQAFR